MDLVKRLEEYRERERALTWEGTFAEYFELVDAPAIGRRNSRTSASTT